MKYIWVLNNRLSGSAYAFSTKEKAENAMIYEIELFLDDFELSEINSIGGVRLACEIHDWDYCDMYITMAEWQD